MRILGYIGTYNEGIDRPLEGLQRQTYPVDEILIVDNASSCCSPQGPLPPKVTLIRNRENLGPSGAIETGLKYAADHNYDWIWIFDADSTPHDDALGKLVSLYNNLEASVQREIGILSCSKILVPTGRVFLGRLATPGGPRMPKIVPGRSYCECDITIWSGSLFKIDAVRKVGMPRHGQNGYWEDLGHDYGDIEFSHRIRRAGYRVLIHRESFVDQLVGESKEMEIFGLKLLSTNHPPGRRYLFFRNLLYFWLYLYPRRHAIPFAVWFSYRFTVTLLKILIMEDNQTSKLAASFRGAWHGIRKKMDQVYDLNRA